MNETVHGYIGFLLHAHLPYVRQESGVVTLEERWYYEAVADSYLPLIEMAERLIEDEVPFRLTLSVSPTLLAMMSDPLMKRNMRKHLAALSKLAQREVLRLWGDLELTPAALMYQSRYKLLLRLYDRLDGDLIGKLRSLRDAGCIELITCAATHAFLPLVKNAAALRAQLEAAVTEFRRHFGFSPAGVWLPECGYTPAAEPHLKALGLRYFVVDAHAHTLAQTTAPAAAGRPLLTRGGACAFARDPEASAQVWSAETGYPSGGEYRDYYRDIGYDLGADGGAEWDYIKPYVLPDGKRIHTGLKYYRVTGPGVAGDAKAPYRPELAALQAQRDAEHFVAARAEQLRRLAAAAAAQGEAGAPPVIVCPYDAELFGHWWYEGPQWLEAVLRGLAAAQKDGVVMQATTLGDYAAAYPPTREAELPVSSWGRGGYAEVWLQPRSQWVQPRLHEAEDRMIRVANLYRDPARLRGWQKRALDQAARELLLAQSSDWTFMLDAGTVTEYAQGRIRSHLERAHKLLEALSAPSDPAHSEASNSTGLLLDAEWTENLHRGQSSSLLFPELEYTLYQSDDDDYSAWPDADRTSAAQGGGSKLRILMLAWEYPPRVIGGLARAVCDLAEQLAASGHIVHVVTCQSPEAECPSYEIRKLVHVHRVPVLQSLQSVPFLDWVFQMNLAFADSVQALAQRGAGFDVIHAHDWLVYYAARECKQTLNLPLIATIHATEYGRNQGRLESDTQLRIHDIERRLTEEADRVIVCSRYMIQEISRIFFTPEDKCVQLPNGVRPAAHSGQALAPGNPLLLEALEGAAERNRILCFMGRLVHEKGVHLLIEAMRLILKRCPEARLVIAGDGPALSALRSQADRYGDRIRFTGFLDDHDKACLLAAAELCAFPSLYEPFGLVALEAMASGTPLVVSSVGGLAEIVEHGVDGYTSPPGSAHDLAERIVELLERPELGAAMAQTALKKTRTAYDWTAIAEATAQTYLTATHKMLPL